MAAPEITLGTRLVHTTTGAHGQVVKGPYTMKRNCGAWLIDYVDVRVMVNGVPRLRTWRTDNTQHEMPAD